MFIHIKDHVRSFPRKDNYEKHNDEKQHFFSKTTGSISTKLRTSHPSPEPEVRVIFFQLDLWYSV